MVFRLAGVMFCLVAAGAVGVASASAGPWKDLHRPLDLPRLAGDEQCSVSEVDDRVDWASLNIFGSSGTGRGPVYPGLGSGNGTLTAIGRPNNRGWYEEKLFWYVGPNYRDRVLIRGKRIDRFGELGFNDNGRRSSELRIRRKSDISWNGQPAGARGEPSGVRFRHPGCYAVQIDGVSFSRKVIFKISS